MKSPILCLLWFMSMLTARAESPSEAEVREFLGPALHPAMSADEHKKLLEAAAGNAGDALLASAYGTNTLSAALLAGDPDVRVLHAMDFKPGTFASTNLLQGLRHPCEEADIQYELTEHGVHLSFAPGRVRQPDPEPEIEPKPTTDDFGFGIEPSP